MRILNPKKTPDSKPKGVKKSGVCASSPQDKAVFEFVDPIDYLESNSTKLDSAEIADARIAVDADRTSQNEEKKEYQRVYGKGIYLLSMREHSVKEISDKLSKKCDRADLVRAVVDDLIERKYLSNTRFAESYVRSRKTKGFGPTKIRSELLGKGIVGSMIDDHLEAGSAIWYEVAENQYHKKYGEDVIKDYNTWTKRARFLQSRGFSMEHIHSTIPQATSD